MTGLPNAGANLRATIASARPPVGPRKRRIRATSLVRTVVGRALVISGALFLMIPVFYLISTSLKSPPEVFVWPIQWIPHKVVWSNYIKVFTEVPFARYILNSIFLVLVIGAGNVLGSSLAAFGFAYFRFRGRNLLFGLMLATMMVPYWVVLVPQYVEFQTLGWLNTYLPLIVPQLFAQPFFVFLLRQFFMSMPNDVIEAARVDGCSWIGVYWRIALPIARPALVLVAVFSFMNTWNEFLQPLIYIQKASLYPVSLGLGQFQSEHTIQFSITMAATVVTLVPVIIVFGFAQKRLVEGVPLDIGLQ